MLESLKHEFNSFLTLTYNESNLPDGATLVPEHFQLFIKRLRRRIEPLKLRYYSVGEYGDSSQRPHYHAALFGLPSSASDIVADVWSMGHVMLGSLTFESAQYIAGYVTKKMTNPNDPRLCGRYPEFARMSLRPGIGADSVDDIALVMQASYFDDVRNKPDVDVPTSLRHSSRLLPLGRYLRSKLREKVWGSQAPPPEAVSNWIAEMRLLFETEKLYPKNEGKSFKEILKAKNLQKVRSIEARANIFNNNKIL